MRSNTVVNDPEQPSRVSPEADVSGRGLERRGPKSGRQSGPMRLQDLIAQRKKELRLTYAQMVQKASDAGYPVSRTMFHHFADREWPNIPTTESLRGIAAAIEVDVDEVLAAAAESTGITPRELHLDRGTRALLALLEDRTPEQIAALESVVRTVTKAMDAGQDSGSE
jgi:hypothetical protein